MNRVLLFVLYFFSLIPAIAQTWRPLADIPDMASGCSSFVIGDKIYVHNMNKFWMYDTRLDTWTPKKPLPGMIDSRQQAVAFAINGKGYLGMGEDLGGGSTDRYKNDLWQYDPAIDRWARLADLPSKVRTGAACFVIGNKAYVGGGFAEPEGEFNDFWQYDQATDIWTRMADLPVQKLVFATGFSIDDAGYFSCGYINWRAPSTKTFRYMPSTNTWMEKASFPGGSRSNAVAFVLGNRVYMGTGMMKDSMDLFKAVERTLYTYDPYDDVWEELSKFPGENRMSAMAVAVNNKGYFGTGVTGMAQHGMSDWWEFTLPADIQNPRNDDLLIWPNPAKNFINILMPDSLADATISYNLVADNGAEVAYGSFKKMAAIDVRHLSSAMYFLRLKIPTKSIIVKKIDVLR